MPVPQSAAGVATVLDSQSASVAPAHESPKSQVGVATGHDATDVPPGTIQPQDQGATQQALPTKRALTPRGSVSFIRTVPQPVADEPSEGKASRNIEEESGKTDMSIKEPKASLPFLSKTASDKTAEPADHAVQKADKPMRVEEPSGSAGSTSAKPGIDTTSEPADHAVQKAVKPVRGEESSGPAGSSAVKSGTATEEDSPDPNKLMDWFINKRAR
jgi:hypothetical protein